MQVSTLKTTELLEMAAPYNPRRMSGHDFESLRRSLRFFGAVEPIVVNKRSGRIVGGHQRVRAAHAEEFETLPVVYVDLDEPSERQLNLALNRITGEFDTDMLAALLRELDEAGADLELTGFEPDEIDTILNEDMSAPTGLTDPDDVPEPPEEPATRAGDLIILGDHRLLCGDATNPDDVARLLDGVKPDIMVTDPPYGVSYDPSFRSDNRTGTVSNDDRADWTEAWRLFAGRVAYVWHSSLHVVEVAGSLASAGFDLRSYILWAKERLVMGRGHYHWQHEPCWYAVRRGESASWAGDRTQSTVWSIASVRPDRHDDQETVHGTQKPVECMARPMRNHGKAGWIVFDPFLGSGSTLIAAEQYRRRCFGLEVAPVYCDVIVKRWQYFTGRQAEGWRGEAAA